ncbi:MAG: DUF3160 domain-containing protein [Deltaproteobacteria bacterium]|nr:DUF3160 domain-containing protein [Deltaproteobacteria bacterium]
MSRPAIALLTAALTATTPLVAHATPEPIEQELFSSWVGRYQDMTAEQLLRHARIPEPNRAPLPFSPKKARFYDEVVKGLSLSSAARATLEAHGVALVEDPRRFGMAAAYYELYTKDLPLLVTTDSILDAMHRSFDTILAELEDTVLRDALERALRKVQMALPALASATPGLVEAAADLDLYLTVALNLLDHEPDHGRLLSAPRLVPPAEVLALLKKVASLQLENPGFGTDATRLYGEPRAVDWSQFAPRGHYTKSPRLARYFRAMMWLGRADTGFLLEEPRQLRAAALFAQLLAETGANAELKVIDDVVALMVGRSDDLGPRQMLDVLAREKLARPSALLDVKNLSRLAEALSASGLGQQRIRSQLVLSDPDRPGKVPPPPIFQVFGQRFVFDSFVLAKVVYDDILFRGEKVQRKMPTGLDVMAALGSDLALRLLAAPGGELSTWRYAANLAALRDVVGAWSEATWSDNLYSLWLDALRALSRPPVGKHVPAVMQREAWASKMLQTQLASWAQLRHDTILYAKQSYTASIGCLYPEGFVEPYPDFYRKLGRFAREAERRLQPLAASPKAAANIARYTGYFGNFAKVMDTLAAISERELRGEELTGAQEDFLEDTIERQLVSDGYVSTPDWSGWYVGLVFVAGGEDESDAIDWKPTIADVHTDPDSFSVLEVGTGNVDFAVVAIDNEGDTAIHVGPTLSYYEFRHPAPERLTDEQWSVDLATGKAPARPAWIQPLLTTK